MAEHTERVAGYVVDLACIRRYPKDQLPTRSRAHTKRCAMMGHCVESGYGLVDELARVQPLDAAATPLVYEALQASARDHGIWLVVERRNNDDEMETVRVEERPAPSN